MIDETVFKDAWVLLCERFNRAMSPAMLLAYYNSLSPRMSTDEFKRAAQHVFDNREFFPKPADFIEALKPDVHANALTQWEQVQLLMSGERANLDPEAKRVVAMLGGEGHLRNSLVENIPFVRKEFLKLYGDAATIALREAGERIQPGAETPRLTDPSMRIAGPQRVQIQLPESRAS
jgi:hypothetical protein